MDLLSKESLGFADEDDDEENDEWKLEAAADNDEGADQFANPSGDNELQIMHSRRNALAQKRIQATQLQKLAFLCCYTNSATKSEIITTQHPTFNDFVWIYLLHVLCKNLPCSYLYLFLSIYSPDHHLFLSKMVPAFYASKFIYVFIGMLQLSQQLYLMGTLLFFIIAGVINKSPWNRCPEETVIIFDRPPVKCYEIEAFVEKVKNITVGFDIASIRYLPLFTHDGELFQVSHLFYYYNILYTNSTYFISWKWLSLSYIHVCMCVILVSSSLCFNLYIYRKTVWKAMQIIHWLLNFVYFAIFLYLLYVSITVGKKNINAFQPVYKELDVLNLFPLLFAESMVSPPLLHILGARSTQEVKPGRDSAVLMTYNTIYCLCKGFIVYEMKLYCNSITKIPVNLPHSNSLMAIYWPIFFSTFFWGSLYLFVFHLYNFLVDFVTFSMSNQFLIECVINEWKIRKRFLVQTALVACIAMTLVAMQTVAPHWAIIGIAMITLLELTVIYFLYPFGRLKDDITFHYHAPLSIFTETLIHLMILYTWSTSVPLIEFLVKTESFTSFMIIFWGAMASGFVYEAAVSVCVRRKGWAALVRPVADWGPRDANERSLRKMYSQETYIASQAPRELSRNLLRKTHPSMYRLGLRCRTQRRHSSPISLDFHYRNESDGKNKSSK